MRSCSLRNLKVQGPKFILVLITPRRQPALIHFDRCGSTVLYMAEIPRDFGCIRVYFFEELFPTGLEKNTPKIPSYLDLLSKRQNFHENLWCEVRSLYFLEHFLSEI